MENKGGNMGLIILSIVLLVLITVVTMCLEYLVGQVSDESTVVKAVWLAGLIGVMALDLTLMLSPIWEAIYNRYAWTPAIYDLPINLGTVAIVLLTLSIDGIFLYLCIGMGIDSFRGRPRKK
ncbi:hypothetical protein IIY24_01995 [Candidatus Saccharibacteria bacterium]|nr:hypothetical protein [Candidatus Saccharibacteria bacterium]